MERTRTKSHGSKAESSEEEGDFESADEGEERQDSSQPFSATSPVGDEENSTSGNLDTQQVQRETTGKMDRSCASESSGRSSEGVEEDSLMDSQNKEKVVKVAGANDITKGNSPSASTEIALEAEDPHSEEMSGQPATDSRETESQVNSSAGGESDVCVDRNRKLEATGELSQTPDDSGDDLAPIQGQDKDGDNKQPLEAHEADAIVEQPESAQVKDVDVGQSASVDERTTDNRTTIPDQTVPSEQGSSGWGWGGWGSLLSQATSTVTTGLSSVIETVETSLGVPDPEEMAKKVRDDEQKVQETVRSDEPGEQDEKKDPVDPTCSGGGGSLLSSLGMAGLTSMVESKGMDLVTGGLGALEFIGKKTMDVISEGDHGLRHKRQLLAGKGESLSQMLREAKEESEEKALRVGAHESLSPMVNYSTEFDQYQGLAHLEALEILSRQSAVKLESRMIDMEEESLRIAKPLLRAIEETFRINEDEEDEEELGEGDFPSSVTASLEELKLGCVPDKLHRVQKKSREWIDDCVREQDESPGSKTPSDIYSVAISTLAELTARAIEQFHKSAELILLMNKTETSALVRAQSLHKLTETVQRELSSISTSFAGCLNTVADDAENPETVSPLITSVYLESANSVSYVTDAFKLLRPVLQVSSLDEVQAGSS